MSMERLYLVRHGENKANLTKEFSHQLVDPEADMTQVINTPNHNCAITEIELSFQDNHLYSRLVTWAAFDHPYGPATDLIAGFPEADRQHRC